MASPIPSANVPPSHFGARPPLSPRSVAAGNGASWWAEAWRLFVPSVGVWLLIVVILFVLSFVLAFIPVVGHLAGQVMFPVFLGGLMLGCQAIDRGQPLTVNHLFAGFSERAGPLFVVGLLYTCIAIAIVLAVAGILLVFFGVAVFAGLSKLFTYGDPFAVGAAVGGILFAVLVWIPAFPAVVPAADHGDMVCTRARGVARAGAVGRDENVVQRLFAERSAVPRLRPDRHRSRRGRLDTAGLGMARRGTVVDRVDLHQLPRHFRGRRRGAS